MLQVKNIHKEYKMADMVQVALGDVSLAFRESEFVAILGPSGSGKTTLLNILGGLDRYDSGDLIIDNISTKQYKDRDWDSYRNHSVGFIFQSYNLIPHQSLLSNVELALTISGVPSQERKQLAYQALEQVGLKDHVTKKPNMISGGQAQRVSIARALVNNPKIVLADEPTGALDSKTSVEIMEMLKDVAKDRLVVMVTHNPELAHQYANRIIELKDGAIISDSNPYNPDVEVNAEHKNMGHSSMSFWSSCMLSLNNLRTKAARTFLTAFAGSIGIIGIAMILALSNGVNAHIQNIQEETLSEYPLTIMQTEMDMTALMEQGQSLTMGAEKAVESDKVEEVKILMSMLGGTTSNDLKSFKVYVDMDESHIKEYSNSVEYAYNITPNIYRYKDGKYRKLNPDPTFSKFGNSSIISIMSAMRSSMSSFNPLPEDAEMYQSQYELLKGHWPENYLQCVIVLTSENKITDMNLYVLDLKDNKELDDALEKYSKGENVELSSETMVMEYDDLVGIPFKLVNVSDCYEYDEDYDLYVDKSDNKEFMTEVLKNKAEDMEIVGVVRPKEGATAAMLMPGIAYMKELDYYVMEQAHSSEIVQKQMENPSINVFTGEEFGKNQKLDMSTLFQFNEDAFADLFKFDNGAFNFENMDLSGMDFGQIDFASLSYYDGGSLSDALLDLSLEFSEGEMYSLFNRLLEGYMDYAAQDASTNYAELSNSVQIYLNSESATGIIQKYMTIAIERAASSMPGQNEMTTMMFDIMSGYPAFLMEYGGDPEEAMTIYLYTPEVQDKIGAYSADLVSRLQTVDFSDIEMDMARELYEGYDSYAAENSMPQISKFADSFTAYMQTQEAQNILAEEVFNASSMTEVESQFNGMMELAAEEITAWVTNQMVRVMSNMSAQIAKAITEQMESAMSGMMDSLTGESDEFADILSFNMDSDSLSELMTSMLGQEASYESNLSKLNYATRDNPYYISIYPKDFAAKQKIMESIDHYNELMQKVNKEDRVITYSDTVATLMSSVSTIVNTISYILVAFVSVSLVVSSIMIGIITYISVLERTKEIGILRAIGASKKNITQVFNAETGIIGLLSGLLGIGITLLLLIPTNIIVDKVLKLDVKAAIAPQSAFGLIVLSIVLTLIGGLIPAKAAAKKDPVTALRTE